LVVGHIAGKLKEFAIRRRRDECLDADFLSGIPKTTKFKKKQITDPLG